MVEAVAMVEAAPSMVLMVPVVIVVKEVVVEVDTIHNLSRS